METAQSLKAAVAESLAEKPIIGVVRTSSIDEAETQARQLIASGLGWVEITFTVPGATELVELLRRELGDGPPFIGMGTVTTADRAARAVEAGAAFLVTPNVSAEVAVAAHRAGIFLVLGALTPTEIVEAHRLGADLIKVYPLPPVGGATYLQTIRGPLGDLPMLAAGGFGIDEIPAYRRAGARAFGLAAPLLTDVPRALRFARGEA